MSIFKPKMYKKSIYDIDYQKLKEKDIKLIIFDLDNTIGRIKDETPPKKVIELINKLSKDFKVVVASNNMEKRVYKFCSKLNCDYFSCVLKPSTKIGLLIKKKYKIGSAHTCIIGDQLLTDILMGNRLKMFTILVDPISEKEYKITHFNRLLEKRLMKRINLKKGDYYE